MTLSDEAKVQLRLDFLKTWVTFLLAMTGGEVTLLNTLYTGSNHKWVLYISIASLITACILMLGAAECLINRIYPPPAFTDPLRRFLVTLAPKSPDAEWLFSSLAGGFTSLGLVIFGIFVIGD